MGSSRWGLGFGLIGLNGFRLDLIGLGLAWMGLRWV